MHVLFLHPENESLGVGYLAAALKRAGHKVSLVFDPVLFRGMLSNQNMLLANIFSRRKRILEQIKNSSVDLVAFSVLTDFYAWAKEYAAEIKKRIPEVPIIFGGIHPTLVPDYVLKDRNVDFVCVGEGEVALVELANALQNKDRSFPIPNIWYRSSEGGIARNEPRKLIDDLDELSFPDKELFYEQLPQNIGYTIITGRGCLFRCIYCCHSSIAKIYKGKGRLLRRRSVDNVITELVLAEQKFNKPFYIFDDDNFTYDTEWVESFSERYAREIGKPCFVWVEPSTFTPLMAKALARMNCFAAEIGVQNINESYRHKFMQRFNTNEQIRQAIRLMRENRIEVIADNIVGCPQETTKDIENLVSFYNENRPSRIMVFFLRYFPKVEIIKYSNFTPEEILAIGEGGNAKSFVFAGDTQVSGEKIQLMHLLQIINVLPKPLINFFLTKRIYRLFPRVRFAYLEFMIFFIKQLAKGSNPWSYMRVSTKGNIYYILWWILRKSWTNKR